MGELKGEELLITEFAGTRLRLELDRIPLWRGDHVGLKQLAVDFAKYLYLPRLKDSLTLLESVRDGLGLITWRQESFAYADRWDAAQRRYRGLRVGNVGGITLEGESVLVKPDVAAKQMEADKIAQQPPTGVGPPGTAPTPPTPVTTGPQPPGVATPGVGTPATKPRRFHGSVELDAMRVGRDAGKIAEEVIQHLSGLPNSKVDVTLEIRAEAGDGVPENIVRTVTENCRTLKFTTHGFEEK